MAWAAALSATAYYTVYPLTLLVNLLLAVLTTLAAPWYHVASYIVYIAIITPWRILLKFEPLYIFFSVAGVLGVSAGIVLHFLSGYLHQLLNIAGDSDSTSEKEPKRINGGYLSRLKLPSSRNGNGSGSSDGNGNGNEKKYVTTVSGKPDLRAMREKDAEEKKAKGAVDYEASLGKEGVGLYGDGRVLVKREGEREPGGLFSTTILEDEGDEGDEGDDEDSQKQQQPSQRLKGKARKQACEAAGKPNNQSAASPATPRLPTRTILVKEFVSLADYIAAATNPPVVVPASFVAALNRAISTRRKHGEQLSSSLSTNAETKAADERHLDQIKDPMTEQVGEHPSQIINDMANRFEGLEAQEPSEQFINAPGAPPKASTGANKEEVNYGAEHLQDIEEASFAFTCIIEDYNTLRVFLARTWQDYQEGMIDLVSASLLTNTAIDFAKRMSEDAQKTLNNHGGFGKFITWFYIASCMAHGESPEDRELPNDEMNFEVYNHPGFYGTFDRTSDRSRKSARDKFREDKITLMEILPDFLLFARVVPPRCWEDELTRGLRLMFNNNDMPGWLIFATQIFLNIHNILREEVDDAFSDLSTELRENSIKQHLNFHSSLHDSTRTTQVDKMLESVLRDISHLVGPDFLGQKKREHKFFPDESFKLLKWNPLLCGTLSYHSKIGYQELSFCVLGVWGSVAYTAHLYNAIRNEKLGKLEWRDMELVLSRHDEIFVGERPRNPVDCLKRFHLLTGGSAADFARKKRSSGIRESKNGPKCMLPKAEVSRIFMDQYLAESSAQLGFTEEVFELILADATWEEITEESRGDTLALERTEGNKQRQNSRHPQRLSPNQLLCSLRNAIQAETLELNFNYLTLHRFCWEVLRHVHKACAPQLQEIHGPRYLEKETQLPFLVGWILSAATGTERAGNIVAQGAVVKSRMMMTAAEAVDDMIQKGGSVGVDALYSFRNMIVFKAEP
ncbi:hypothetical protein AJ79_07566 [Helicocarpus griseus UAMH5409]|uniref:DUF6604 domain-containing protein n=1 Tax=Helicocarpus griseus UAMH5409 TaxID=1447875 RepID=A0A2B7X1P7_9EURO|nr:hypothetical protein AJ79_07566 [Helicocarpus griseus UAMH5409]